MDQNDPRREAVEAYAQVFATEAGKTVLRDLEMRFGFLTGSMYQGDVHAMCVNEGSRKVLVHIGNMLTLAYEPATPLQEKAQ